ncbi:kelch domain-containing protein 10-like [Watersipora subatra]|uniref:kelch domain-containing protein 10-like n=1 Tax=Watersipora subatra TaxID=2589382 RepID=UPI00355C75B4
MSTRWKTIFPQKGNSIQGPHAGPHARSGHRIVMDAKQNIYCYGGYNPVDPVGQRDSPHRNMDEFPMFRELWMYNCTFKRWRRLSTTGTKPEESASYACVLIGHRLLLFGGTGYPFAQVRSNELYCCDLTNYRWTKLKCDEKRRPSKVYGHSMTHIGKYIYLFGGTVGFSYVNDMYRLDLDTLNWELLRGSSNPDLSPSARYRHETAAYDDKVYVFGGGTSTTCEPLDIVWEFDPSADSNGGSKALKWRKLNTVRDDHHGYPKARKCHGCVQIGPDVYISGGIGNDNSTCFRDMWKYNIPTRSWSKLPYSLSEKTYFHAMTASPDGSTIYSFGGVKGMEARGSSEERLRNLSQLRLSVRSLADLSWERLAETRPKIRECSRDDLAKLGVPAPYIDSIDRSPAVETEQTLHAASAS